MGNAVKRCIAALILGVPFDSLYLPHVLAQSDCPPCFSDQTPMNASGCDTCQGGCSACPECGTRRVIMVKIASSWDTSPGNTDPNIWNGVVAAVQMWNAARDQFGNQTAYCFQVNQATSNPDIKIKRETPSSGCAETGLGNNGGPYTIRLPDGTQNYSNATIAGREHTRSGTRSA